MRKDYPRKVGDAMVKALEKSVAVYNLLHSHARGETDLTEDQLANVVTRVAVEAQATLDRARGRRVRREDDGGLWVARAHRRAPRRARRLHS